MGLIRGLPGDCWSACNNPAGLSCGEGLYAGVIFMNQYLMEELENLSFMASYSFKDNGIGLAGRLSGFGTYFKQSYALSYGRKFGKRFRAGISLVYLNLHLSGDYPSCHTATFGLGMAYHMNDRLIFSFYGINPFHLYYSNSKNFVICPGYACTLSYQANEHILLAAEIESDTDLQLIFKGGIEYGFQDKFFMRLGASGGPFRMMAGAGMKYSRFILDISMEYHSYLGFSPNISLIYHPSRHSDGENM